MNNKINHSDFSLFRDDKYASNYDSFDKEHLEKKIKVLVLQILRESTNCHTFNEVKSDYLNFDKTDYKIITLEFSSYTYIGKIVNSKANGHGIKFYKNGDIFVGSFASNYAAGRGIKYIMECKDNICKFEGMFRDGYAYGKCTNFYNNGIISYHCLYDKSEKNGIGRSYYYNGSIHYQGEFKNNSMDGTGKYYRESGNLTYEGKYEKGKRHGMGGSFREDGSLEYEGEWAKDQMHGKGAIYRNNGTLLYKGQLKQGKKEGKGECYHLCEKLLYEGSWKDNKLFGKGKLYDNNGNTLFKGSFNNFILIDEEGNIVIKFKE